MNKIPQPIGALIPGFTNIDDPFRRFVDSASLVVVEKIDVKMEPIEAGQVDALVRHIARDIQAQIIRSFRDPKTGRVYPDGKGKGGTYRASAPGEPPAIKSGDLLNATWRGLTFPLLLTAELTIDTGYETFLELGTTVRRKMAPRPYVIPAINEILSKLVESDVISSFERVTPADLASGSNI